jgi:hypothetical protein
MLGERLVLKQKMPGTCHLTTWTLAGIRQNFSLRVSVYLLKCGLAKQSRHSCTSKERQGYNGSVVMPKSLRLNESCFLLVL